MLVHANRATGCTGPTPKRRQLAMANLNGPTEVDKPGSTPVVGLSGLRRCWRDPPHVLGDAPVGLSEAPEPAPVPSGGSKAVGSLLGGTGRGARRPGPETVLSLSFLRDVNVDGPGLWLSRTTTAVADLAEPYLNPGR